MALVKADGSMIPKSPGASVLESVVETDPQVKVLIDVYNTSLPEGTKYPPQRTQKLFRAGQVIRQSQWDKHFAEPEILSVMPDEGPTEGGTAITIKGKAFVMEATVTVGGNAATNVVVVDPETITAETPAGTAGAKDVVVTTVGGSDTATGAFTYTE